MSTLLSIMAIVGAMSGAILAVVALVLSLVLDVSALMIYAGIFGGLALLLTAVVFTWGPGAR